jgi:hypothetical protein
MLAARLPQGFVLPNPSKLGAITSIFSAVDYSKSGTCDVVVGRDDGSLEVSGAAGLRRWMPCNWPPLHQPTCMTKPWQAVAEWPAWH